jgi:hypothetical protein
MYSRVAVIVRRGWLELKRVPARVLHCSHRNLIACSSPPAPQAARALQSGNFVRSTLIEMTARNTSIKLQTASLLHCVFSQPRPNRRLKSLQQDMQRATKSPEIRYFAQSLWTVPVAPAIDYTDALQKQITYERLRSSLLHCTHDGLERLSGKQQSN